MHFYDTDFFTSVKRGIICMLFGLPCLLPKLISKKGMTQTQITIFRTILPTFLQLLYIFGLSKIIALKFGVGNTKRVK